MADCLKQTVSGKIMDSTALLKQALNLYQQGEVNQAIQIWQSIEREDSPEAYAKAQFYLGVALGEQGDIKGAIEAYCNVQREDSPKNYAKAQVNLGNTLREQGDIEGAIEAYCNVQREDSPEAYAKAQLILGIALGKQADIKGAIEAYCNVQREDSPEAYAHAQLILGITLEEQGDIKGAIETYCNVQREDTPETYAKAQVNLGNTLGKQGDIKGAIRAYRNVQREDSPEVYAKAQVNLGITLGEQGDVEGAIKAFQNSKTHHYYKAESYIKILTCPKDTHENLQAIFNNTANLLQKLHIKSDNTYEQKVAHYTKATVAKLLIQGDDKNPPSSFRLNSIKNVNDPTEGLVLGEYLQNQSKPQQALVNEIFTDDENTNVFISCFTFNHDSLNQFRLYGKEDNKEASGVSLVFKPEFFNHTAKFGFMSQALKLNELDNPKEHSNKSETPNKTQSIEQQALYRCIYIDPKSGYLRLAQRNKITFYREAQYGGQDPSEAQKNYTDYKEKYIEAEEKEVEDTLIEITKQIEEILQSSTKEILEAIGFILLPLRYLIKHTAFQEEQECRMIYITDLNDEKICEDWHNKNLYINYDVEVKNMVDKIYLSPGAYVYADFFRRMLPKNQDNKERVRRSDNPFRC
ncbi:lipopolysaccharide assembly protein LapB [Moraxella sp. VT-16-12]|uniref:tetratricopeptide repeat protein n=1 Tax=Moraxella sp. VT-16-12 TaxID=2014877 RepID=UPI001647A89C|nr:tetratricopeptide repeat protein [Moraxella sp. VT-16-12]